MPRVFHKGTKRLYTVYGVQGLLFLVWDPKGPEWLWLPIAECEPVEDG